MMPFVENTDQGYQLLKVTTTINLNTILQPINFNVFLYAWLRFTVNRILNF